MKKLKNLFLFAVLLIVGFSFSACSLFGDDKNENQNQKQKYTITYMETKGMINNNPTSYTEDSDAIVLTDLSDTTNSKFVGWYNGNTKITQIPKGTKGDLVLVARWEDLVNNYTITYQDTKGVTNENPTTYTEKTETIILKNLGNTEEFKFIGWYNGEEKVTEIAKGTKGNLVLTAKWEIIDTKLLYTLVDGYYEVSGIKGKDYTDLVIPKTYNGLPVKAIGKEAFLNCYKITSITIPEGVTRIGENAFEDCYNLKNVTIPESVNDIGSSAFCMCMNLVEITIPKGVTNVGDYAFSGCSGLLRLKISKGVTNISKNAFSDCERLTEVFNYSDIDLKDYLTNLPVKNIYTQENMPTSIFIKNDVYYYNNGSEKIVLRPVDVFANSVVLEDNYCTKICDYSFYGCELVTLTIPKSVKSIDENAFSNCVHLIEVYNLSSVDISGYMSIIKDIYTSLNKQSKLIESNGVIYYVENAEKTAICSTDMFAENITLDNDCLNIYLLAFVECENLTSITIPTSLKNIGMNAFTEGIKVYYIGTKIEWSRISIDSDNMGIDTAKIYFYNENKPTYSGNYWHYNEQGMVEEW